MKLRNRILTFNLGTFSLVLIFVGIMSFIEFREHHIVLGKHRSLVLENESPAFEAFEIVLGGGSAALILALIFSRLFLSRALGPISEFAEAMEKTDIHNLAQPVHRSGNGDEIDRLAVVFHRLKQRIDLSLTQSREFTMHASHELKTPLSIMHGNLEQLLSHEDPAPVMRQKLVSMLEEVQRLSLLTEQLIFLAKADAEMMATTVRKLQMDDLVREWHEDCVELGRSRKIRVELRRCDPVELTGDKMRMRQLLLNLADNAVKYNQPDGIIELSLIDADHEVQLIIANSGKIIPPAARQRIFERFYRGDVSHASTIEGSGLGLSICQAIVSLHGGHIAYDIDPSGRNRFTITFAKKPCRAMMTSPQEMMANRA